MTKSHEHVTEHLTKKAYFLMIGVVLYLTWADPDIGLAYINKEKLFPGGLNKLQVAFDVTVFTMATVILRHFIGGQ